MTFADSVQLPLTLKMNKIDKKLFKIMSVTVLTVEVLQTCKQ